MNLPDFIILGETKCGTTSLFNYLIQHPKILDTKGNSEDSTSEYRTKEIRYFDRYYYKGIDWYSNCFPNKSEGELTGEATPMYLYRTSTIQRIKNSLPNTKFIILLREPVSRLYSNFNHNFKWVPGFANKYPTFDMFWNTYHDTDAYLVEKGLYYYTLIKWFEVIDRSRFLIIRSEDLYLNTQIVYSEVLKFLGTENFELKSTQAYRKNDYEKIEQPLKRELESFYAPHNEKLFSLLNIVFWKY